ncbi:hypothetical protein [Sphingomonas aerophila]|jgi:hypothetical protein|uniref:Uncharacterized protein n=1 Tax=Sphingomonas aerophila TaxID=1344948 RepID=A0A7W9BC78_9SPHN|nr:hypothetical protein [Sphingomonas aerophila]MBB5714549.1 hypothetical protein [Sphingomonas aerophila]
MLELVVTAGALLAATLMAGQSGAPDTSPRPTNTHKNFAVHPVDRPKPRPTPAATQAPPPRETGGVVPPGAPGTGNPTIPGTPVTPR